MVTHGWLFGIRFIEHLLLLATQQETVNEGAAKWRNKRSRAPAAAGQVLVQIQPEPRSDVIAVLLLI